MLNLTARIAGMWFIIHSMHRIQGKPQTAYFANVVYYLRGKAQKHKPQCPLYVIVVYLLKQAYSTINQMPQKKPLWFTTPHPTPHI